jgi:hypothetical protein
LSQLKKYKQQGGFRFFGGGFGGGTLIFGVKISPSSFFATNGDFGNRRSFFRHGLTLIDTGFLLPQRIKEEGNRELVNGSTTLTILSKVEGLVNW